MGELNDLMWAAWLRVRDTVLGDEGELRRRLARREKVFEQVPRALCIAIRASDHRINDMTAWIGPRRAIETGREEEHQVLLTSRLMRDLWRPVEVAWLTQFTDVSERLGSFAGRAQRLERQGILKGRRISLLGGKRGKPVPVLSSGIPATAGHEALPPGLLMDAGARDSAAPHRLLLPYWRELGVRLPEGIEQTVVRRPIFRVIRGRQRFCGWKWVCPGCRRDARTLYFPMGAPDWAGAHGIELPEAWYDAPHQPGCLACGRCHDPFGISVPNQAALSAAWNVIIGHMSGGLLYGREVERPAWFCVERKRESRHVPRASPRRDELEEYLVNSDLSEGEIARRMGIKTKSAEHILYVICKRRGVKGREGLRQWWEQRRAAERPAVSAA